MAWLRWSRYQFLPVDYTNPGRDLSCSRQFNLVKLFLPWVKVHSCSKSSFLLLFLIFSLLSFLSLGKSISGFGSEKFKDTGTHIFQIGFSFIFLVQRANVQNINSISQNSIIISIKMVFTFIYKCTREIIIFLKSLVLYLK